MKILIDIGGTKTRIAVTDIKDSFEEPTVFQTPQEFEEWLTVAKETIQKALRGRSAELIVIGVPGTLTENKTKILRTPHLDKWSGIALKERMEVTFSCRAVLENDTALVGLGEANFGAGKGHPIVAYVTISTGVNGVRIVDGKIDKSTSGFEIGHTIIDDHKQVEYFISGSALEERYGKPSHEVHDASVWEKVNHYAGLFGANTIMYWSPSIIVYGGPVMNDLHIEIIEKEAKRFLSVYEHTPIFVRGTLKDFGGLYGALARSQEEN